MIKVGTSFFPGPAKVLFCASVKQETYLINLDCRCTCLDTCSTYPGKANDMWIGVSVLAVLISLLTLISMNSRQSSLYFLSVDLLDFHVYCRVWDFTFVVISIIMVHINVVVMILRVGALYNRSKLVLGILLTIYAAEEVTYFICNIIFIARSEGNSESEPKWL